MFYFCGRGVGICLDPSGGLAGDPPVLNLCKANDSRDGQESNFPHSQPWPPCFPPPAITSLKPPPPTVLIIPLTWDSHRFPPPTHTSYFPPLHTEPVIHLPTLPPQSTHAAPPQSWPALFVDFSVWRGAVGVLCHQIPPPKRLWLFAKASGSKVWGIYAPAPTFMADQHLGFQNSFESSP